MNVRVTAPSPDGLLDRYPGVSVSDARATLATVIDGVKDMGQRHLITRHGRPIAAVICMPDLLNLEANDASAQSALSWPEGDVGESETLTLTDDPDASAIDAARQPDLEELMRKTGAAIRQDPRVAKIVSDVVDIVAADLVGADMPEQAI